MDVANVEICRSLLSAGADVRAEDDEGHTVLMWLTNAYCCRLLLEAGAKADAVDRSGCGVLWNIVSWAKRRQQSIGRRSAIDVRYNRNLALIFRLLIAAGTKLDVTADDGETALDPLADLKVPEAKKVLAVAPIRATKTKARS